jgi:tetratricopeptide (TPR) repeat protein
MLDSILKADFVLADISTLNANVLYELGIRHAVRKNTTIIISEEKLPYPFDLSHILIERYQHLGDGIDYGEVVRFKKALTDKIKELVNINKVDSPLYTYFPNLEVPRFTQVEIAAIKEQIEEAGSLADYISQAEQAKNEKRYRDAINALNKARALHQDNLLVIQRLALVTYKSEIPDKATSLHNALRILEEANPSSTTDVETLGLCGAIYKRLYETVADTKYLQRSMEFYEKGFYIKNDYYNGINVAFLYNIYATVVDDKMEAYGCFGNASRIRDKVYTICHNIIQDETAWKNRDDKEWVYLTLAEVYCSRGDLFKENLMIEKASEYAKGTFSIDSYNTQKQILNKYVSDFKKRWME